MFEVVPSKLDRVTSIERRLQAGVSAVLLDEIGNRLKTRAHSGLIKLLYFDTVGVLPSLAPGQGKAFSVIESDISRLTIEHARNL